MKCKESQRKLSYWVDGCLKPVEAQALEQHLGVCPSCADEHRRLLAVKNLLAFKRHEQPSPLYLREMLDEFHRRLEAQESARKALPWAGWRATVIRTWWERTERVMERKPILALRYALGTALVAVLALNAAIVAFRDPQPSQTVQAQAPVQRAGNTAPTAVTPAAVESAAKPQRHVEMPSTPSYVLERLSVDGGDDSVRF